jgi:allophanate hydrolase
MLAAGDNLEQSTLRERYRQGDVTPQGVVSGILQRLISGPENHVWISRVADEHLIARARFLQQQDMAMYPLYGIPFAVKDNIDVVGLPTTAACPAFSYQPTETAPVVSKLLDAGAMLIGKTNLDQFATGLVGTRTPYGVVHNAFDPTYIAGGSSAGSAVAVASGYVSFALGTDTAGSGRIPAAFNNIIGLKPTRGMLSTRGIVPACRSLDCISIFALSVLNAWEVLAVTKGFDPHDPFSRPYADVDVPHERSPLRPFRFGIPASEHMQVFDNHTAAQQFDLAVQRLVSLGGALVDVDFTPFIETAHLLYEGPWIAERYVAIRAFLATHREALHPVTRDIIEAGATVQGPDVFAAYYRLKALRRAIAPLWNDIDVLVTPTASSMFTIAQVEAEPIRLNTQLGYYTNFMNLLDLSAIAIPAGFLDNGLPFGITLAAPAFSEAWLCTVGDAVHRAARLGMGATGYPVPPMQESGQPAANSPRSTSP